MCSSCSARSASLRSHDLGAGARLDWLWQWPSRLWRASRTECGGELAQLSEPDLVPRAVASVLNVRAAPGRSLIGALADHLQTSRTLLVLDNCEHLIEGCAVLAEMLLRPARTCVSLPQAVKLWALVLATLLLSRKGPWSVPASCSTDYDPAVVWLWRKGTLPNRYRQLVRGTREAIRAVAAGCVGNFVEWHDFVIYLYSVPIIATLFFPSGNRAATILAAFALWSMAFVARPPMRMRSWSARRAR
jgi:hypothetical protein